MTRHSCASNRGAVIVTVAVCALMLLGIGALVIDLGRLYVAKQRAQNVADASAIAAAWCLDGTPCPQPAVNEATTIALANNQRNPAWRICCPGGGEGVGVSFPVGTIAGDDGIGIMCRAGEAVQCDAQVTAEYGFARSLGLTSGTVNACAVARRSAGTRLNYPLVPWCASTTKVQEAANYMRAFPWAPPPTFTLKVGSPDDPQDFLTSGNFLCIDYTYGGGGADEYYDRIVGIRYPSLYSVNVAVGSYIATETGNKVGKTQQGLDDRIGNDRMTFNQWWTMYRAGTILETPRIAVVPVVYPTVTHGTSRVMVAGFAGFFIENYSGKEVEGHFIGLISDGTLVRPGLGVPASGPNLLTSIELIK